MPIMGMTDRGASFTYTGRYVRGPTAGSRCRNCRLHAKVSLAEASAQAAGPPGSKKRKEHR